MMVNANNRKLPMNIVPYSTFLWPPMKAQRPSPTTYGRNEHFRLLSDENGKNCRKYFSPSIVPGQAGVINATMRYTAAQARTPRSERT
jgi:hypothetical protein